MKNMICLVNKNIEEEKFIMEKYSEKDLKKLLDEYSDLYYNEGQSPITDEEFDKIVLYYNKTFNKDYNTETEVKEGKRLVDISHTFPNLVGVLSKAYDITEVQEWLKSISKRVDVSLNTFSLLISEKYDGNSAVLTFNKDGSLNSALTRGKDGKGLDLKKYFEDINIKEYSLIKELKDNQLLGIKCEIIITYEDFEELSLLLDKEYSNPRNLTAGILNSLDGYKYSKYLTIVPLAYDISNSDYSLSEKEVNQGSYLKDIKEDNYKIKNFDYYLEKGIAYNDVQFMYSLETLYNQYVNTTRNSLPYMIDGLVIEILNEDIREKLGRTNNRNNYQIAVKFPSLTKRTKMIDIEWYQGKTGRVTPVAVVEPVYFNGAKCDRISLSNIKRFNELNLYKGESVIIEYHGDVLSYLILDPNEDKSTFNEEDKFKIPTRCEVCGSNLVINDNKTFLSCNNENCSSNIVGKLTNFFIKLNIKGIKESTIELLVNTGEFNTIQDFYIKQELIKTLDVEKLGDITKDLIVQSINQCLYDVYDYDFFGSLGIEGIANSKSELIFSKITIKDLLDEEFNLLSEETYYTMLDNLKGVGKKTIDAFYRGISNNIDTIKYIMTLNDQKDERILIKDSKPSEINISNDNEIINVVFSGIRDKSLEKFIKEIGYDIKSSVSKNTDIVVVKDTTSTSSKVTKANDLGIEVIEINEFKNRVNFNS